MDLSPNDSHTTLPKQTRARFYRKIKPIASWNSLVTLLLIAVSAALLAYSVMTVVRFPKWVVDDAFIVFRYAENLVDTGQLNWNPGEDPVEGYTGFMLIVLVAGALKLGIAPILASHIIGIFFFFAGAAMLLLLLRGFNIGSVVALALYTGAPFMYAHVWSGLETMMFSTAILFALYTYVNHRQRIFIASILFLGLVRPEGALLAVILLAIYRPFRLKAALWFVVPAATYFIWRYAYYGNLLPNTFYTKTVLGTVDRENVTMIKKFFKTYLPMPALLALIFVSWEQVKKHRYLIIGVAVFCGAMIFNYLSSNLIMNFAYRFLVPLYVLSVLAIGAVVLRAKLSVKTIALAAVIIWFQLSSNMGGENLQRVQDYCRTHYQLLKDEHMKAAEFIKKLVPDDEWLIVHADAGTIPYYTKLKTIDFGRLNNEYLTQKDLGPDNIVDYFYAFNAGVIVFTSYRFDALDHDRETNLIRRDKRFNRYKLIKKYKSEARKDYFEFVYLRNDIVDSAPLARDELIEGDTRRGGRERRENNRPAVSVRGADGSVDVRKLRRVGDDAPLKLPEEIWNEASSEQRPSERIRCYRQLVTLYPEHESAPRALFMIGFVFVEELNRPEQARQAFEELVEKYPNNEITEQAKWMIETLDRPNPEFRDHGDTLDSGSVNGENPSGAP